MRGTLTSSVFLALLSAVLVHGQSRPPIVKIQGRVIYDPTQRPLKDVVVKLIRPDRSLAARIRTLGNEGTPEMLGTTKTDSNGNFSFATARPGPYEIICFRAGPHAASGDANVDPRKFVFIRYRADPVPFTLRPGQKPP